MTLGFKTKINGKPNYFPEKIIAGLDLPDAKKYTLNDHLGDVMDDDLGAFLKGSCNPLFPHHPKLHTIREDKKNRWGAGCDIHAVINNRTANRFQFAPVMKCVSVQTIYIYPESNQIWIGNKLMTDSDMDRIAVNDGFYNIHAFFEYFNEDFHGKIIHWTNLKY